MLNTSVVRVICVFVFLVTKLEKTFSDDAPIIGPADLNMINVVQCENYEELPSSFVFEKKKFNRTVEILNGVLTLDMDLDESVSIEIMGTCTKLKALIYINVAKWGDGGYKPNFVMINDTSACHFFFEYLNRGVREILSAEGRPESCPVTKGKLLVKNYLLDSRDLPEGMMYGLFKTTTTLVKNGEVVLCYIWILESKMKNVFG